MRSFIISTIIIAVVSAVLQLFLLWWIITVVAFIVAYLQRLSMLQAFASGFVAVFLLWSLYAFFQSWSNEHLLAQKVATLLPLGGSIIKLTLVTGFIGGLVSGFAAMSGAAAKQLSGK